MKKGERIPYAESPHVFHCRQREKLFSFSPRILQDSSKLCRDIAGRENPIHCNVCIRSLLNVGAVVTPLGA